MFREFNFYEGSPRKIKPLPFRYRLNSQKKRKLTSPEPQNSVSNVSLSGFDPKIDLKTRIMKAIMSGNDTIEKEMAYKKNIMSTLTPRSSQQGKQYRINLSLKSRNEIKERKWSNETITESDEYPCGKYEEIQIRGSCSSLEINKDGGLLLKNNSVVIEKTNRSQSLSNYNGISNKLNSPSKTRNLQNKPKASIEIKPWNSIENDEPEFGTLAK